MNDDLSNPKSKWMRSLVEAHAADLTRYAASILRDSEAAKDVVQDTFLRLWREPRQKMEGHERPWLFRVCRHRALDYLRKGGRMQPMNEVTARETPLDVPDPQSEAERQDSHTQVLEMMRTLPDNQQEVVRLKFQNDMSYKEIAAVTELSVGNVGFLLHTALQKLRQRMVAAGE